MTAQVIRQSPSGPAVLVAGSFVEAEVIGVVANEGLRALQGEPGLVAIASGYAAADEPGGGVFSWDETGAANNDGTFIAVGVPYGSNVAGPGWRRLTFGAPLNVAWFGGATGGGFDATALARMLELVTAVPQSWSAPPSPAPGTTAERIYTSAGAFADVVPTRTTPRTVSGTSDTIIAADWGSVVVYTSASAVAVSVPAGLPVGFSCTLIQKGAGQVTVAGSGSTLSGRNGLKTAGQNAAIGIQYTAANEFVVGGDSTP